MSIIIGIGTFVLIIVCVFLVLVVLAQKAKNDGGVGAAMGGGMTEATFGAETGNVLTKATINASIAFFVLSFLLYLGHIYQRSHGTDSSGALPTINAPAAPAPATPAEPAPMMPMSPAPAAEQPAADTAPAPAQP